MQDNKMNRWSRGIAAVWAGCLASIAGAATYHVIDLGTLGGSNSAAWAINEAGIVVGQSAVPDTDFFHAFRWDNGLTDLGLAGAGGQNVGFAVNDSDTAVGYSYNLGDVGGQAVVWSGGTSTVIGDFVARDINAAGTIVGAQTSLVGGYYETQAVAYAGGVTTPLGTLGGNFSAAAAVHDGGWVVGTSTNALGISRAFVVAGGGMTDLGTLGGASSQALGISDTGYVVGVADTAGGVPHAFRYALDGTGAVTARTDLGELGSGSSYAYGVNSAGHVVGTSDWRAFLWDGTQMNDLNAMVIESGWSLSHAVAINDAGLIAGRGRHFGEPHAFLLVPASCSGDLNGDNQVDLGDLSVLLTNFGTASGATYEMGDLNGDGAVDLADLADLLVVFGTTCG